MNRFGLAESIEEVEIGEPYFDPAIATAVTNDAEAICIRIPDTEDGQAASVVAFKMWHGQLLDWNLDDANDPAALRALVR